MNSERGVGGQRYHGITEALILGSCKWEIFNASVTRALQLFCGMKACMRCSRTSDTMIDTLTTPNDI